MAEILEEPTEEREKKVEQAVDVITAVSAKVDEKTRKVLFRSLGIFDICGKIAFYTSLIISDAVDAVDVDEVSLSMEDEELRTEIVKRLNYNGLFNINKNA